MARPKRPQVPALRPSAKDLIVRPNAAVGTGGIEGAGRAERETFKWNPSLRSANQLINHDKPLGDARARDMVLNDGRTHGVVASHKDSIVGSNYRLSVQPKMKLLERPQSGYNFDKTWREEFQAVVEAKFNAFAESRAHWLDASRRMTLTDQIRLAVGGFCIGGEVLAVAKWLNKDRTRPLSTAVQMVNTARLSNPRGIADSETLSRGVEKEKTTGRVRGYHIRYSHPSELPFERNYEWEYVPAYKPWGREQVLHILEPMEIGQDRGISDMVAALKNMRMLKLFSETVLQRAVVDATYTAALESELPPDMVYGTMGGGTGPENFENAIGTYMDILKQYFGEANVSLDGVKMPVLPPGVKMQTKTLGTPGGVGSTFEDSLMRGIAASLGVSFEEFSKDYSKTNYSSMRGADLPVKRFMKARKKLVADSYANWAYQLFFEESFDYGDFPLPTGVKREFFYRRYMKEALTHATWIGAGAGQIDEMKETQAAVMRVGAGLSTREKEIARFGDDWREVFEQLELENSVIASRGLTFSTDAQRPGARAAQDTMTGTEDAGNEP